MDSFARHWIEFNAIWEVDGRSGLSTLDALCIRVNKRRKNIGNTEPNYGYNFLIIIFSVEPIIALQHLLCKIASIQGLITLWLISLQWKNECKKSENNTRRILFTHVYTLNYQRRLILQFNFHICANTSNKTKQTRTRTRIPNQITSERAFCYTQTATRTAYALQLHLIEPIPQYLLLLCYSM